MTYDRWPALAREGFSSKVELPPHKFRRVYLLGMGGSASGGDIIASWLAGRVDIEVVVFKGQMPVKDMKDSLAIACSASGETAETIRMMKTAIGRGADVLSISAGGSLEEVSGQLGVPHLRMPKLVAPRYTLPHIIFSQLSILDRALGLGCEAQVLDAIHEMDETRSRVALGRPTESNPAKKLALALVDKTPVIYGQRVTRGVGVRFKNVINENAKKHAIFDGLPDGFHNDIESWEYPQDGFVPVFLRHSEEDEPDRKRTSAMVEILRGLGRDPVEVMGSGKQSLSQLVSMVYELDMASYYMAIALGRDPYPVPLIETLKQTR